MAQRLAMTTASYEKTTWRLDKDRHVKYWRRCLKTFLPSQYTSNDSNRMYLAYLILSSLELLDVLDVTISPEERAGYIAWIYRCQHRQGGFRMWPGTDFGPRSNEDNSKWDPAHVPATYFALTSLLTLGDDLRGVRRTETLTWLTTMQRSDGSFGETIVNGRIEGGNDPRFGYCATGSRYILFKFGLSPQAVPKDINAAALARSIKLAQSYDGGIADTAFNEPHAGYTFCALGALAFMDKLQADTQHSTSSIDQEAVLRWLVQRQTDLVDPDSSQDSEFIARHSADTLPRSSLAETLSTHSMMQQQPPSSPSEPLPDPYAAAGMNGRLNKVADTCYCWWVGASLNILGHGDLFNHAALRRYLLQLTQHPYMGGFCKFPDDHYADIYHSFMGLAALSLASTVEERKVDGIKEWDAEMCISKDIRRRINHDR